MKPLLITLCILLAACSQPWTKTDTLLALGSTAAAMADAYTTTPILNGGGHENDPILGRHPSNERMYITGAIWIGIATTVSYFLPPKIRRFFLGGVMFSHSSLAISNYRRSQGH